MAVLVELIVILLGLASFSGSSDVFRHFVQLDIQRPVPEFHDLLWVYNRTNVVLKYYKEERKTIPYPGYEDRVEFDNRTYSLILKNLQKTDGGLYEASASNARLTGVAEHRLSVLDPVEAPVLSQSSDTCSITLTCRGHFLSIHSSCYKNTCEEKEVTSPGGVTLSLSVRGSSIICNHSNPASWKEALLEMGELAQLCANGGGKKPSGPKTDLKVLAGIVLVFVLIAAIASASPSLTSLIKGAKRKKCARDNDENEGPVASVSGYLGVQGPVASVSGYLGVQGPVASVSGYLGVQGPVASVSGYLGVQGPVASVSGCLGVQGPVTSVSGYLGVQGPVASVSGYLGVQGPVTSVSGCLGVQGPVASVSGCLGVQGPVASVSGYLGVQGPVASVSGCLGVQGPVVPVSGYLGVQGPVASVS
ncbi:hypothetical protein NFI96_003847, partial [Prochilodus magdalenae]